MEASFSRFVPLVVVAIYVVVVVADKTLALFFFSMRKNTKRKYKHLHTSKVSLYLYLTEGVTVFCSWLLIFRKDNLRGHFSFPRRWIMLICHPVLEFKKKKSKRNKSVNVALNVTLLNLNFSYFSHMLLFHNTN